MLLDYRCTGKGDTDIYVFYADVFLLQSCLMNLGILLVSGALMPVRRLLSGKHRIGLLSAASVGAGVFQLLILYLTGSYPAYLFVSFLVLIPGMVYVLAGREPVPVFCRRLIVSYLVAVVLGGVVGAAENLLHLNQIPVWILLLSLFAAKKGLCVWKTQTKRQEQLCTVTLRHKGKCVQTTALWDTGNCLREPEGERPVHIISAEMFRKLEISANDYVGLAGYCSLGNEEGILPLYEIDGISADANAAFEQPAKAVVACAGGQLLAQKTYQVILNVEGAGV
jgi:hypothetical protein